MSDCEPHARDERSNVLLIAATSAAILTLLPIAAHQLRLLDHLPDPPYWIFNSDRITGARSAHPLSIPDSVLGLGSYSLTLTLAVLAKSNRRASRLLAIKLLADGSVAAVNVARQIVTFRRLCSWCTGTALCTAVMVFSGGGIIRQEVSKLHVPL